MGVLNVFLDGTLTGQLNQDKSGNLTFSYNEDYRASAKATPLSLSMPLEFSVHTKRAVLPLDKGNGGIPTGTADLRGTARTSPASERRVSR